MDTKLKRYLPSIVYGGSDGAVSYFALMAGGYGAGVPLGIMIAIGVSNIVADAFSMASADYLSEESKTSNQDTKSSNHAMITLISFIIIGFFPIIPSIYGYFIYGQDYKVSFPIFMASVLLTLLAFVFIGYMRGKILKRSKIKMIAQSVIICTISASVAYFVGEYVSELLIR
ncbi:MAG: VIT1/CCC1 transporter family protein [Candidatus Pacebacteria bacterium]|nr:VIT1/CCC1 transporter family protein [Candidatus Paceibacterota bacterium]